MGRLSCPAVGLTFYAFLALSTPVLLQTVLGDAASSSTEEAMTLLSRPGSQRPRNYHGIIVHLDRHDRMRQEIMVASEDQPGSRTKNRMNDPPKDQIPDVNHPQVKAWVAEIDWSKVPNIPVAHFPKCPPRQEWMCSVVRRSHLPNDGGQTYDDGPSEATREMMQHLSAKKLSATFFIVGSRVLEYLDILKVQVEQGHQIAMHTWSHAGLTIFDQRADRGQIRWSEKIIRDVAGLAMKYVRPPYGKFGPDKGNVGAIPASKGDSKSVSGDRSKTKSDASVPVIQNGLQILSYAAMGLTLVASYMLTL